MNIIIEIVLPIVSLVASFVFFVVAWGASKKAEALLAQITKATDTWQNDIMKYVSESLNSDPNIVGHKIYLSRIKTSECFVPIIEKLSNKLLDDSLSEDKKKIIREDIRFLISHHNIVLQNFPLQTQVNSVTNANAERKSEKP